MRPTCTHDYPCALKYHLGRITVNYSNSRRGSSYSSPLAALIQIRMRLTRNARYLLLIEDKPWSASKWNGIHTCGGIFRSHGCAQGKFGMKRCRLLVMSPGIGKKECSPQSLCWLYLRATCYLLLRSTWPGSRPRNDYAQQCKLIN